MNIDWLGILKSTRVQALIAGLLFTAFGKQLGVSEEQVVAAVALICSFIIGRSMRAPAE